MMFKAPSNQASAKRGIWASPTSQAPAKHEVKKILSDSVQAACFTHSACEKPPLPNNMHMQITNPPIIIQTTKLPNNIVSSRFSSTRLVSLYSGSFFSTQPSLAEKVTNTTSKLGGHRSILFTGGLPVPCESPGLPVRPTLATTLRFQHAGGPWS